MRIPIPRALLVPRRMVACMPSLKVQVSEKFDNGYEKLYKKKRELTQENDQNVQSAATSGSSVDACPETRVKFREDRKFNRKIAKRAKLREKQASRCLFHLLLYLTTETAFDRVVNCGDSKGLLTWNRAVEKYDPKLRLRSADHLPEFDVLKAKREELWDIRRENQVNKFRLEKIKTRLEAIKVPPGESKSELVMMMKDHTHEELTAFTVHLQLKQLDKQVYALCKACDEAMASRCLEPAAKMLAQVKRETSDYFKNEIGDISKALGVPSYPCNHRGGTT